MKTYVMSDIHGREDAYFDMLEQIGFDDFGKRDKLYIIGDVVDRGAGGIRILQHILKNKDKIEFLMGNHELMMLQAIETNDYLLWMYNGGLVTYEHFIALPKRRQAEMVAFLKGCKYQKTVVAAGKKYYLVHGRPYQRKIKEGDATSKPILSMPPKDQTLWAKMMPMHQMQQQTVVFGHVCTKKYDALADKKEHYEIYEHENMIGIDCGCAYTDGKGRLGCLCLHTGEIYYSTFAVAEA